MHKVDDITIDQLTKIEGDAALTIKIEDGKVKDVQFALTEYKRFYTEAIKGKPIVAIPQLLARICGTCSNAHIMCSLEACESALGITPSPQTVLLRMLTMYGLMLRDHALHLYLFVMPDVYRKDSFLDFDENDPLQHQILHDAFDIKGAGNFLSNLVAGRSVHAPYPVIGGFTHFPDKAGIDEAKKQLEKIRPAVLRTIKIFDELGWQFDRNANFMALVPERFGFLTGCIKTSQNECIEEKDFRNLLEHLVFPYSQASAYKYKGESYMVGALARLNLAKELLNEKTKETLGKTLDKFPSTNVYLNNLAQAIEILHSLDESLDIFNNNEFKPEPIITAPARDAVGVGVIEAPRGTLYHKITLGADGIAKEGEIIVPTGQNHINIQEDIFKMVDGMLAESSKDEIVFEVEKLIRAYDPCISCASHFLKVDWQE